MLFQLPDGRWLRGRSLCRIRGPAFRVAFGERRRRFQPIEFGRAASIPDHLCRASRGGGSAMPRVDILIAAMLATATIAGGYDLQSPATREMATNECILDSTRDSDVPLAGLRAYCQCTVDEMAKQLTLQEMNKYGDAEPDALPLELKAKIEAITGACMLKAGNQYPEFGTWAADK